MQFISNGDFLFPFTWPLYAGQQFYTWSYQTGAANPSGIIRMPGRLLDLLVFMLFGNVGFGYFYIVSSLAIVFIAFLIFARKFLQVESPTVRIFGALFFAINPIFLGNLAKVGLVLAAAMLPLCLVALKTAFAKRQHRYFLVWMVLLNVSLIHPYTFVVNFGASGAYFAYLAWHNKRFVYNSVPRFLAVIGVAILLNAYFILPQASMRTISKNVLTNTISSTPVDYTALVNISNTGDIFTGLSLSKNILKDFDFYNPTYMNFYFLGTFLLYVLLFGAYMRIEKRMAIGDRTRFVACLSIFLVLVLLATVKFLHIDALIRFLITMPGGWAFRSPLKWQLYIPLVLFSMLMLVLQEVRRTRFRLAGYTGLVVAFVLMNGYIAADVYHKILTPRSITHFSALQQAGLDHKNILLVSSPACMTYEEDNPTIFTELNQVLISNNVQVKQIASGDIDIVNLGSYDFLMDCQNSIGQTLAHTYDFSSVATFDNNNYELYHNDAAPAYVRAMPAVYQIAANASTNVGSKYDFVTQLLHQPFTFVDDRAKTSAPVTNLQDAFEDIHFGDIHNGHIETALPVSAAAQKMYVKGDGTPLYYAQNTGQLSFSAVKQNGYQLLPASQRLGEIPLASHNDRSLQVSYADPAYQNKNLIPNSSLEQGPWQGKVGDCYAHDSSADVHMKLVTGESGGSKALQLSAGDDIACSGPNDIAVTSGQHYLVGFDYQTLGGQYAGYDLTFDDDSGTSLGGRLMGNKVGSWQNFTKGFTVPAGAHHVHLLVYAYSDSSGVVASVVRYDNFQLSAIPNIQDRFYVTTKPVTSLQMPAKVTFAVHNPTSTSVDIAGAHTPFYLVTSESYSAEWRLELAAHARAVSNIDHLDADGSMNAWYVDPAALCARGANACSHQPDGSYDLHLVMTFAPQRWFYAGATISGLTTVGVVLYFVRANRPSRLWRYRK